MQRAPVDEQQLGERTAGVWTLGDAAAAGIGPDAVAWRVRIGRYQRLRPGVFCDGGIVPSPRMRAWAAVLAAGGEGRAWSTARTTLRMLGLPLVGVADGAQDDVLVPRHRRGSRTLHVVRRQVLRADLGRYGGCPSVSAPVALLHAATWLDEPALVCSLDGALHRGLLGPAAVGDLLRRYGPVPGAAVIARAVGLADGRAESPLETLGRLALLPVLPDLEPQVAVHDRDGRLVARVDLADRRRRLAVEADGRAVHAGMAADDHRRDRVLTALGWRTERYTWADVHQGVDALRRRVLAAAARADAAGTSAA